MTNIPKFHAAKLVRPGLSGRRPGVIAVARSQKKSRDNQLKRFILNRVIDSYDAILKAI